MFYIGLKGGLGNQMFQYAFGVAASMESNIPLVLDTTLFDHTPSRDTKRAYLLHHFNTQARIASENEVAKFHTKPARLLRKIKRRLKPQSDHVFYPELLKVKNGQYLEGYWQSEKYFKKYKSTIQHELSLRTSFGLEAIEMIRKIKTVKQTGAEAILVHIRRGDYITNQAAAAFHGAQNLDYFARGISYLDSKSEKSKHIFIATDDIEWVKANFKPHHEYTFISRPGIYDFEEILIMADCDHFVISNSSFSWWGAWLGQNPHKIVVAPKNWVKDPAIDTSDVLPEEWIKL